MGLQGVLVMLVTEIHWLTQAPRRKYNLQCTFDRMQSFKLRISRGLVWFGMAMVLSIVCFRIYCSFLFLRDW